MVKIQRRSKKYVVQLALFPCFVLFSLYLQKIEGFSSLFFSHSHMQKKKNQQVGEFSNEYYISSIGNHFKDQSTAVLLACIPDFVMKTS